VAESWAPRPWRDDGPVRHLLVTNDFPPKVGGIQSYLWELWRRLPADDFAVLTTPHDGDAAFDAAQPFRVERTTQKVLLPTPALVRRIDDLAAEIGADAVVLDPALPLGLVGPRLSVPYWVVIHGAEATVPARLPGGRQALRHVLRNASQLVASGPYPAAEIRRVVEGAVPIVEVPPGVDARRFRPLDDEALAAARADLGLPVEGRLVVSVSRLVPRKGMDVLIEAAACLAPGRPDLTVAIAGDGREHKRLERLVARTGAPVHLLGNVPHAQLPALYGCADVFAMLCRNRWGGLEQEGFGIVFLEAAATGVPQVAGASGGAGDAVAHGATGLVVDRPAEPGAVAAALAALLDDDERRRRMGQAARRRAVEEFDYDGLAERLGHALSGVR
jgi:phosphatidyl-myo-inositol dimannoside synthase